MAAPAISSAEVRRLLGDIGAHKLAEVVASGASLAELEEVAAHLAQETDVMGQIRRPLTGRARAIYELIRRDEDEDDR